MATWPQIWSGILHYLILLGLPAVTATSTGEAAHPTRSADKGDVVIALGFRRSLRQTVEGLQQSRPNGAYCVGIADTTVSSSARFSHECLIASVETPSYGASYAAPNLFTERIDLRLRLFQSQENAGAAAKSRR